MRCHQSVHPSSSGSNSLVPTPTRALHVMNAPSVGREGADRGRAFPLIAVTVRPVNSSLVCPNCTLVENPARAEYSHSASLGNRYSAPDPSRQPSQICLHVVPRDLEHRSGATQVARPMATAATRRHARIPLRKTSPRTRTARTAARLSPRGRVSRRTCSHHHSIGTPYGTTQPESPPSPDPRRQTQTVAEHIPRTRSRYGGIDCGLTRRRRNAQVAVGRGGCGRGSCVHVFRTKHDLSHALASPLVVL